MSPIFQNMLSRYEARTQDERSNAIHEVMQQITLAGLYKAGFFNCAAFYGSIVPQGRHLKQYRYELCKYNDTRCSFRTCKSEQTLPTDDQVKFLYQEMWGIIKNHPALFSSPVVKVFKQKHTP